MKLQRRNFLQVLAAGSAGALLPASVASASTIESTGTKMLYRTLGKTGLKVPVISSGIVPQDNLNLCRAIFKSGMIHFDSAWDYQEGRNSRTIGQMIKEFGRRKFIISTKVLLPMDEKTGLYTSEATAELLFKQLDAELERLQIPSVDILYLHKPLIKSNIQNKTIIKALLEAKRQGKTRFIGISAHSHEVEALDAVTEAGFYDVVLTSVNYQQDPEVAEAINRAADAGLGIIGMKVHAGGFLDKERTQPVNKVAATKWALQNPNVHTVILTMRTYDEFEQFVPLMQDITLTEQEKSDLEHFTYKSTFTSIYCSGCHECIPQCKKHLPIPDAMRAFMYAYGYRDLAKARHTMDKLRIDPTSCTDCDECTVTCKRHFDVRSKLADISRIKEVPRDFLV